MILNDASFQPALNQRFVLMGARKYVASLFGMTEQDLKKAPDADGKIVGKSMKEIREELTEGKNEAEIAVIEAKFKQGRRDYDTMCDEYYKTANRVNALLSVDPNFRKVTRPTLNKDGKHTGSYVTRYVPVKASSNASAKIAALEAEIAKLRAAALPAPAVA